MSLDEKVRVYKWKGRNRKGRKVSGEIVSTNRIDAGLELENRGIEADNVREKSASILNPFSNFINNKDLTIFTRQLGMLLTSSFSLMESMSIVADGTSKPKLKSTIIKIRNSVSNGDSFATSLSKEKGVFDEMYINMIYFAEKNGTLPETLLALATHMEKKNHLKSELKKAMAYPSLIVVFAIAVIFFMMVKIIPEFETIYATYDENLPEYTAFMLGIARYMQANASLICFGFLLSIVKLVFSKSDTK